MAYIGAGASSTTGSYIGQGLEFGQVTRTIVTATDSQKAFTGLTYSPGQLDVFLNGVLLVDAQDYTATNGTIVSLTSAASVSDIFECHANNMVATPYGVSITLAGDSGSEVLANGNTLTIAGGSGISTAAAATDTLTATLDLASANTWTAPQRNALTVDNDGSFDMDANNNFKCTPSGSVTLTFTNHTDGQSGYILLVNSGGETISLHANTKADANLATTVTAAGTYIISYIGDGTNAYLTNSAVMA